MEEFIHWVKVTAIATGVILALVLVFAAVLALLLVTMGGDSGTENSDAIPESSLAEGAFGARVGWSAVSVKWQSGLMVGGWRGPRCYGT